MLTRRKFLLGLGATAPVAIAASNLMKVKALVPDVMYLDIETAPHLYTRQHAKRYMHAISYSFKGKLGTHIYGMNQEKELEDIRKAFNQKDPYQALADMWNATEKANA